MLLHFLLCWSWVFLIATRICRAEPWSLFLKKNKKKFRQLWFNPLIFQPANYRLDVVQGAGLCQKQSLTSSFFIFLLIHVELEALIISCINHTVAFIIDFYPRAWHWQIGGIVVSSRYYWFRIIMTPKTYCSDFDIIYILAAVHALTTTISVPKYHNFLTWSKSNIFIFDQ